MYLLVYAMFYLFIIKSITSIQFNKDKNLIMHDNIPYEAFVIISKIQF